MKYSDVKDWIDLVRQDSQKLELGKTELPKITVITPSFNQCEFLEETILSIIGQQYPNLEFFIFDGGSTDNSVNIIKKYEAYIDYWESENDKGQSDAINKGFERATGDIICWLNSDDMFLPNTLNRVADYFADDKVDFLFGKSYYLFSPRNIMVPNSTTELRNEFEITDCQYIVQPSAFWSKRVIDTVGLLSLSLNYCFDWEWFNKISEQGIELNYINNYFSIYRIHADHKSSSAGSKRIMELSKLYNRYHSDVVAESYIRMNRTNYGVLRRKIIKRFPKLVTKLFWKLSYRNLSFHEYRSILQM